MSKTVVLVPIGPNKEYMHPYILGIVRSLGGVEHIHFVLDGVELLWELKENESYEILNPKTRPENYLACAARSREALRQFAIATEEYDFAYWHDCDMLPEPDAISRLLKTGFQVASGVYSLRGSSIGLTPLMKSFSQGTTAVMVGNCTIFNTESEILEVEAAGFGCLLTSIDVLRQTPFRPESHWDNTQLGEDFQWCIDSGHNVGVALDLTPWHMDSSRGGEAVRVVLGKLRPSVTWIGHPWKVANKYGGFTTGVPNFKVSKEALEDLSGPGWISGMSRHVSLETKRIKDVV